MSTITQDRHDGIVQQVVHKTDDWMRYAKAVVESVLAKHAHGQREFAADDVDDDRRPMNAHLSGNVWHSLATSGILEPVMVAPDQIKTRRSTAKGRHNARVQVYRLASYDMAVKCLSKHHGVVAEPQMTLL